MTSMSSMSNPAIAKPRFQAALITRGSLAVSAIAFAILALAGPAQAQRAPSAQPPAVNQPPPQPPLGFDAWGRGPPPPPQRPYVAPMPQVAPPMQRVTPVAPLSPRIGN